MSNLNYEFYKLCYKRKIAKEKLSKEDMHVMDTAYWMAVIEPYKHGYDFTQIKSQTKALCRFFDYYKLIGIDESIRSKASDINWETMI